MEWVEARQSWSAFARSYVVYENIKTGLVYIARQVGLDVAGTLVGPGGRFQNVVKFNCYCVQSVDPSQIVAFREIRDKHIGTAHPPASTFVYVSRLVRPEWLVEVEAVAAI